MGLDALDVGGEIEVEVELVDVLIFILLGFWGAMAQPLWFFLLKCRL